MGTRADFYIGEGKDAEWLGSVAWDGYQWEKADSVLRQATTKDEFKAAVFVLEQTRNDFTSPVQGWPWPWDDSRTSDYAYCFTDQGTKVFNFGRPVVDGVDEEADGYVEPDKAEFPNMKDRKNVTLEERSGVMIFSVPKDAA